MGKEDKLQKQREQMTKTIAEAMLKMEKEAEEKRQQAQREVEEQKFKIANAELKKTVETWQAKFNVDHSFDIDNAKNTSLYRERSPEEEKFYTYLYKNYIGRSAFKASGLTSDKETLLLMYKKDPNGLDAMLTKIYKLQRQYFRDEGVIADMPSDIYKEAVAQEIFSAINEVVTLENRSLIKDGNKFELRLLFANTENDLKRLDKFQNALKGFGFEVKVIEDNSGRHKFVFNAENFIKILPNISGANQGNLKAAIIEAFEKDKADPERRKERIEKEEAVKKAQEVAKQKKAEEAAAAAKAAAEAEALAKRLTADAYSSISELIPIKKVPLRANEFDICVSKDVSMQELDVIKKYLFILESKGFTITEEKEKSATEHRWVINASKAHEVTKEELKNELANSSAFNDHSNHIIAELTSKLKVPGLSDRDLEKANKRIDLMPEHYRIKLLIQMSQNLITVTKRKGNQSDTYSIDEKLLPFVIKFSKSCEPSIINNPNFFNDVWEQTGCSRGSSELIMAQKRIAAMLTFGTGPQNITKITALSDNTLLTKAITRMSGMPDEKTSPTPQNKPTQEDKLFNTLFIWLKTMFSRRKDKENHLKRKRLYEDITVETAHKKAKTSQLSSPTRH